MPIKGVYSTVIQPNKFVAPSDLDLYKQGTVYKEGLAKEALTDISALHNSIFNIPTYGKDKEVLMQKDQELKNQLSQLNLSNLGSMETSSQIKNLISQAANDQDVAAIAQRYGSYANELKRKEDAEAKGKEYISPLLRQAEKYYGSGVYKTQEKFNGSGFISPDLLKFQEAAQKIAPKTKYWKTLPNGERVQVEEQSKQNLASTYYNLIGQDPNGQRYLDDQFETNHEGIDWENASNQNIQEDMNKLQVARQQAAQMGYSTETFDNQLNRLQKLSESGVTGQALKQQYKKNYIDDFVNTWADGVHYTNYGDIKLDELDKMKIEHAYKFQDELNKLQLKTGLLQNKDEHQSDYIKRLAEAAQNKDLEIAKAKAQIQTDAVIARQENANDLKIKYLNAQGESKAIKNKGGDKINLNGETFDKSTILNSLGDKSTVQKIVESNPSKFGLECLTCGGGIDPGTLKETTDGNGYTYQNDSRGNDNVRYMTKEALKAYILDSNVKIDLDKGDVVGGGELDEEVYKKPEEAQTTKTDTSTNGYKWNGSNTPSATREAWKKAGWTEEQINQGKAQGNIKIDGE